MLSFQVLSEILVPASTWKSLSEGHTPPTPASYIVRKFNGGRWFRLCLPQFRCPESGSVRFRFRDVDNPYWKHGMYWDFIEMRRVDE